MDIDIDINIAINMDMTMDMDMIHISDKRSNLMIRLEAVKWNTLVK